tara:strand:- start:231 stop:440 length:210 start_codon:yes stop_codon:yes gene_type:complete
MIITSEEQIESFRNYYSYDILILLNKLKEKYGDYNLLNKCSKDTSNDFVDLLLNNVDLKKMYMNHISTS